MKLVNVGLFGLLLVAGCGGASDDGGRSGEGVDVADDDEMGASDDDEGASDDDEPAGDDDGPAGDDDDEPAGDDDDEPASDDDDTDPPAIDVDDAEDDDAVGDDDTASGDDDAIGDDDVVMPGPDPGPSPSMTTPVPDPVVPSEECTLAGQSVGQGYCDMRQQCGTGYRSSYCSQATDGTWQCQCSDNVSYKNLEVDSAEAPCGTVIELCSSIPTTEFTGEETCVVELQQVSVDYCQNQSRCTRREPYNDQISLVQSRYETSYCSEYGGTMSCSCNGSSGSLSFQPEGVALAEACELGQSLCSGETIEPVGDRTCQITYNNSSTTYCQLQQTCSETVAVGDGTAQITETESGYCSQDSAGNTQCNCYNNSRSYYFSLDAATIDSATCTTAMAVCASDTPPATEGPIECAVNSQSSSPGYCNASIQCEQSATIGESMVDLYGTLYAYCQESTEGWTCQCQSNTQSVAVTVMSTGFDACTEAAAQCPDVVDVEIGTSGGGVRPPCVYPVSATPAPTGSSASDSAGAAVAIPCLL